MTRSNFRTWVLSSTGCLALLSGLAWSQESGRVQLGGSRIPRPGIPQNGAPAKPAAPVQRPAIQDANVLPAGWQELAPCPVTPELLTVLQDWERESGKIETLAGVHERFVYNTVFEVERRSTGEFFYENPDKGRINIKGAQPPNPAINPQKIGASGQPFKVEADRDEIWICTGQEIVSANPLDKTFEAFPLPPQMRGKNIINGPLPFLFGMQADEARRRFHLKLAKNTDDQAWIMAIPRTQNDSNNFSRATIILDKSRYLPFAVQLIDPAGSQETVFKFLPAKMAVNSTGFRGFFEKVGIKDDPYHPDFRRQGYQLVQQPSTQPKGLPPLRNADQGVRPAGGQVIPR